MLYVNRSELSDDIKTELHSVIKTLKTENSYILSIKTVTKCFAIACGVAALVTVVMVLLLGRPVETAPFQFLSSFVVITFFCFLGEFLRIKTDREEAEAIIDSIAPRTEGEVFQKFELSVDERTFLVLGTDTDDGFLITPSANDESESVFIHLTFGAEQLDTLNEVFNIFFLEEMCTAGQIPNVIEWYIGDDNQIFHKQLENAPQTTLRKISYFDPDGFMQECRAHFICPCNMAFNAYYLNCPTLTVETWLETTRH